MRNCSKRCRIRRTWAWTRRAIPTLPSAAFLFGTALHTMAESCAGSSPQRSNSLGEEALGLAEVALRVLMSAAPMVFATALGIATLLAGYHGGRAAAAEGLERSMYSAALSMDLIGGAAATALPIALYLLVLVLGLIIELAGAVRARGIAESTDGAHNTVPPRTPLCTTLMSLIIYDVGYLVTAPILEQLIETTVGGRKVWHRG